MSNQYITETAPLIPGDLARADDVNDKFTAVSVGFDKLPNPHATLKGFSEAVAVGEPELPEHSASRGFVETAMSSQVAQAAASAASAAASAASASSAIATTTAQANAAAASAGAANGSASSAAGSASTAGTQAANAAASAASIGGIQAAVAADAAASAASAASAGTNATNASNSASAASSSAGSSAASAGAANGSASAAAGSASSAAGSAATASGSIAAAAAQASAAANSASTASTAATNATGASASASTSAGTATAAASAATAARDKASQWADNALNVQVESGRFSARHWAETAAATVNGKANLAGPNSFTGNNTFAPGSRQVFPSPNTGMATDSGFQASLDVSGTGGAAFMQFLRPGVHGSYFGLDTDNAWKVGGWSAGAVAYRLWHEGNDGAGSGLDADLLDGLAPSVTPGSNSIAVRDGAGHLYAAYLNQASGNSENPTISQVMATNGSDNFLRKCSFDSFRQQFLKLDSWLLSPDGFNRFYFGNGGRTFYSSNNGHEFRNQAGGTLATIDGSGNFTANANVTAYSDSRLKTEVSTIADALGMVNAMRGVRYTRTDTGSRGMGVIAQEMEVVAPEVVVGNQQYLSVAYGNLAGVFIEAIKELTARVELLEEA